MNLIKLLLTGAACCMVAACSQAPLNKSISDSISPKTASSIPDIAVATEGVSDIWITLAESASSAEQTAAKELATYLQKVTGAEFPIVTPEDSGDRPVIAVGPGAAKGGNLFVERFIFVREEAPEEKGTWDASEKNKRQS